MTLLPLFAALVCIVWWLVLMRYGGLLAGCLIVLISGTCLGHSFFHVSAVTSDRLLLAALTVTSLGFLRAGRFSIGRVTRSDVFLGGLLAILCASVIAHDWIWQDYHSVSRLVFFWGMPAILYGLARGAALNPRILTAVMASWIVLALYLAVTALGEVTGNYWAVWPRYITSSAYPEFLGRGRGPLLNPAGNGILLTAGLFSLLMFWPRTSRRGKFVILATATVLAAGLGGTLTRCVWLGALVGLGLLVVIAFPPYPRRCALVAAMALAAVLIPTQWHRLTTFKRDKDISESEMSNSASLRPILAQVAWKMFLDHPLFGVGLGHYKHVDEVYFNDRSTSLILSKARPYHQHNVILSVLVETGIVGLIAYLGLLWSWTASAWRVWRSTNSLPVRQTGLLLLCVLAAYLVNGMFQDVSLIPMVHSYLFFLAGLTVAIAAKHVPAGPRSRHLEWQPNAAWGWRMSRAANT